MCERDNDGARLAMKKLLPTVDQDTVRRFQRKVRLLSSLDHPHIVQVVATQLNEEPYSYVMPLYASSLRPVIPSLAASRRRAALIFRVVVDAITYAHARGVIHRDLKPDNILVNDDPDLVVADFGLGREFDSEATRQTVSGFGLGTALYMTPEQWSSAKHADKREDSG